VVQVAPTGFSAFVDPRGGVHSRTNVSESRVITRDIDLRSGKTLYVRLGDKPWIAVLALAMFWLVWTRRKPLRR